jgi:HEAT repeat protein
MGGAGRDQGALGTASGRRGLRRAYLRCADLVAAGGGKAAARSVYQQLSAASEPPMIRIAALHGLAEVDGNAAVPLLERELASTNADVQAAAIRLLNRMPGAVAAIFAKQYAALKPVGQVRVLTAWGERDDGASARPIAMQAVKSPVPEVRTAALTLLGKVGDAASVPVLAETAVNAQGNEQAAARESLGRVSGPGVDSAIASAISSSSGKMQLELIRAAGERVSATGGRADEGRAGPDRASSQGGHSRASQFGRPGASLMRSAPR